MATASGEFQVACPGFRDTLRRLSCLSAAGRAFSRRTFTCLATCVVSAVLLGIVGCGETMSPPATGTSAPSGDATAGSPVVIAKATDEDSSRTGRTAAEPGAVSEPASAAAAATGATAPQAARRSQKTAREAQRVAAAETPEASAAPDSPVDAETVPLQPGGSVNADDASPFADETEITPLKLGDAAPPLKVTGWAKGTPVKAFAAGTVYVVEFWATWCGPCRTSMPHMSQLQDEYGEKVQFIGITNEDLPTVEGFLKQPGENEQPWSEIIRYAIALDEQQQMTAAYMQASGQQGIPAAFVVGRTGRVEWIGHPMGMDEPLKEIVAGTWDVDARAAEEATLNEMMPVLQRAAQSENFAEALTAVERALEKHPASPQFHFIKMQILLHAGDPEPTNQFAAVVGEKFTDEPRMLEQIAWMLATAPDVKGIDLDLALKLASRASELTEDKNASILDTIARVYSVSGNPGEALAFQKKAVALEPQNPNYRRALKQYETEAAPSPPSEPQDPAASDGATPDGDAQDGAANGGAAADGGEQPAAPAPPESPPAASESVPEPAK